MHCCRKHNTPVAQHVLLVLFVRFVSQRVQAQLRRTAHVNIKARLSKQSPARPSRPGYIQKAASAISPSTTRCAGCAREQSLGCPATRQTDARTPAKQPQELSCSARYVRSIARAQPVRHAPARRHTPFRSSSPTLRRRIAGWPAHHSALPRSAHKSDTKRTLSISQWKRR